MLSAGYWRIALVVSLITAGVAQIRTSAISGAVKDEYGEPIEQATIVVRNSETEVVRTAATDSHGAYRFESLELGSYELSAEKPGYRTSDAGGITLELDREVVVEHTLVNQASESIEVTAEARLIAASASTLSSLVNGRAIRELPLNGRDYIQLATLEAGAPVARSQSRGFNTGYGLQISVAGSRPFQNGYQMDGVSLVSFNGSTPGSINGVNLGVDSVREFSLQSSGANAQFGRAAGGIVSAVTRSGGNELHGSVFYFHRNDNLDARNYFDPGEPPEFRRHQFGASLGGPIHRNRAFFFVNYEGLREARGNTTINTTLSEAARRGELSSGAVVVDPVMAQVADLYPQPNGEVFGDTGLFVFPNDEVGRQDFITSRVDLNLNDSDRLFARYTFDDGARTDETDFALGSRRASTRPQSLAVEETHVFSPAWMNTARFGFSRFHAVSGALTSNVPGTDNPDLAFLPDGDAIGLILVSGLTDFPGGSGALDTDINTLDSLQFTDEITVVHGRHSVVFGGRLEKTFFDTDSQNRVSGEFRFRSIRQFLTNDPDRFRAQFPESDTIRNFRQWIGAWYVQDTWRVSRSLTLDLGLRHEWATVPTETNSKLGNLDRLDSPEMRTGNPLFRNPSLKNLSPRLGLAWDVVGDGRTVIRSGYGLFPDLLTSQFLLIAGLRNPPFFLRGATTDLAPGDFPTGGVAALVRNPDPDLRVERLERNPEQSLVHQWNLNIEQALWGDASFRLGYVGSAGRNLSAITEDANLVQPDVLPDGRLFFPADGNRINPEFGHIRNRTFDATSSYHGLNLRFQQRFRHGLQAQASYSFSKSIDDSSNFFSPSESRSYVPLPVNGDPRINRGLSAHDVRNSFVASGVWEVPFFTANRAGALLNGWQLGAITTYGSGLPLSARLGYDAARTGTARPDWRSGQRPDLVAGSSANPVTGDPDHWIDPSSFSRPAAGYLGNLGRNTIVGPDLLNVDLSAVKRLKLTERISIDLRFEFFNAFNRTNFDNPAGDRMEVFSESSSREDLGRITSAGESREVQFGLKLRF